MESAMQQAVRTPLFQTVFLSASSTIFSRHRIYQAALNESKGRCRFFFFWRCFFCAGLLITNWKEVTDGARITALVASCGSDFLSVVSAWSLRNQLRRQLAAS